MAKEQKKERVKLGTRLRNKFRLVIMNDETLEEKASLLLSPLNVVVFAGTIIITLITFTIYIIAFTPLREYIPGYTDMKIKRTAIDKHAMPLNDNRTFFDGSIHVWIDSFGFIICTIFENIQNTVIMIRM